MLAKLRHHIIKLLALGLVGVGVVVVVAASSNTGSTYVSQLGVSVPNSKLAAVQRAVSDYGRNSSAEATVQPTPPPFVPDPIPAHMLPANCPVPISPEIITVENDWLVSDGYTLVAVYAGADGQDATVGRIVIVRQDLQKSAQTIDILDVAGSGALSIVNAPTGTSVETSAQTGTLDLVGNAGVNASVNLQSNTVASTAVSPGASPSTS